jgi:hypothetical protein
MLKIIMVAFFIISSSDAKTVGTRKELQDAIASAKPGDTIVLQPANYGKGLYIRNLNGTKNANITIGGSATDPAIFQGGKEAIHLVDCNYVTLKNIKVSDCTGNGINADDGGSYDSPSKGLTFQNITIENIGPKGNFDALKISGLDDFRISNCKFSGWGGSAIDMVGCHDGIIESNLFVGKPGYSQSTGIQNKGGTTSIFIRYNTFKNAGARSINLGGSTGLQFFRPKLCNYEAKDIFVVSNHFTGSEAPIAYVTSKDCIVKYNTILYPEKWILRILQEQPTNTFISCQKGVFENNDITYDKRVKTKFNIGPNTKPKSFSIKNNTYKTK